MAYIYFSHDTFKNKRRMSRIHNHRNHEIYYMVSGSTKYVVGDELFNVEAGNVVIIPKGVFHTTDSENCTQSERFLISFDDALFDDETRCILDMLLSHRLLSIPSKRREELESILLAVEKYYGSDTPVGKATLKLHLLEALAFVVKYSVEAVMNISDADRIVHKISDYINVHYSEELWLEKLSRIFSISESYLSRKFKSVTGVGINEYITFVRIMNAEQLLREGGHSITEVAERCGFNDSNYFSSVFKKIKGTTPLKFSKMASDNR